MRKTFVIAEAGSTHDRSLRKAFALIDAAALAGADACKFQFWSDPERLADRRRVPDHYRAIYHRYAVPDYWLSFLKSACDLAGIEFMCSVYTEEDIPVVAPFVDRFKIASFEACDLSFVQAHRLKPRIVSVGMASVAEVRALQDELRNPNNDHRSVILACTSAYPAPIDQMNVAWMRHLWGVFQYDCCGLNEEPAYGSNEVGVGLSDHSRDVRLGGLAVAAGAEIIEAHLRLADTDPENPDYATAFTPAEFTDYVRNIRFAETVMGDGNKQLQACEREMAEFRVRGASDAG